MRYLALATDYDGTLAQQGSVEVSTLYAIQELKKTGRKLILVTGREIEDLISAFPAVGVFDIVVAENGAVLYRPADKSIKLLGHHPPDSFIRALKQAEVKPLAVGHVIVATWHPHETKVMEVIRRQGLELQIIFNKGAVMILPSGVNKATGLRAALEELSLSPHNMVAIGDAENDHAFLKVCECSVVVANALPSLKEEADLVTRGHHGGGVAELCEMLVKTDLAKLQSRLRRHDLTIGKQPDGTDVRIPGYGSNVLFSGASGGGKTTLATAFVERLQEQGYQYCIIDPEGDYEQLDRTVVFGDKKRAPDVDEILDVLRKPANNAVVNLVGVNVEQRPAFFDHLFPRLQQLRADTGHPHWIIIDEIHHMVPDNWNPAPTVLPRNVVGVLMITIHPDHVAAEILSAVDCIIVIGDEPEQSLRKFAQKLGKQAPAVGEQPLQRGAAILWTVARGRSSAVWFETLPPRTERKRHKRKYAEGELTPDRSFYFRGPDGKLKLRAQNLMMFLQLAEGVDDETWTYHLDRGDYSGWFRENIKDPELAADAQRVENRGLKASESRKAIREAIESRYTIPA